MALFLLPYSKAGKNLNASPSTKDSLHLEVYPITFEVLLGLQRRRYRICLAAIISVPLYPPLQNTLKYRVGKTVEIS